ncbi:phage head morphogenesis protein [Xenorhabdus cabanillasii]|uniref:F protein n=1 Tax=Xenorhabdus cabanillasii JM26 TaxID=1427517 RepID=W1IMQ9_9GAMM|nr:phage head morphogenesis protein [Xenorhabdus cabanillasii]PHM78440.1 phage head morphogenesis protein [Xenorhabdus cabanillasii JM26]CDL79734.1 F protein [Xenorhabdus cabanillasii JM26]
MPQAIDLGYAAKLEPKLAVDYFRAKGYEITWNWQDANAATHARAFTVAKAARLDILTTLREQVDKANSEGITEREFINTLTPRLQEQGWWGKQVIVDSDGNAEQVQLGSPSRLATIYRTNVATAYQAGRYQQQLASADTHPYWQYIAIMDNRTRQSHAAMHGRVFRYDDPIWDKLYPPNDWGCRCRVRALTAAQVKRMGLTVESSTGAVSSQMVETGVDKRTGEIYQSETTTFRRGSQKMTTGAGWSNNAGQLAMGADVSLARKLLEMQNRELRQQVIQSLNNAPVRQNAFAQWVGQVMTSRQAGNSPQSLGFVTEGIALAIEQRLGQSAPRLLTVNETTLKSGLAMAEYQSLPAIVGQPAAVMLDKASQQLLYISAAEREAGRTVVTVPVQTGSMENLTGHAVQVNAIPPSVLRTGLQNGRYELLEGQL